MSAVAPYLESALCFAATRFELARLDRDRAIAEARRGGLSIRRIAEATGMSRGWVQEFLDRADVCPENGRPALPPIVLPPSPDCLQKCNGHVQCKGCQCTSPGCQFAGLDRCEAAGCEFAGLATKPRKRPCRGPDHECRFTRLRSQQSRCPNPSHDTVGFSYVEPCDGGDLTRLPVVDARVWMTIT